MELDRAHGDLREPQQHATTVQPAAAAVDTRWPGGVMMLLILVALGWPLVTLAAAVPTFFIADREQSAVLAGVGAAFLLLRWAVGA